MEEESAATLAPCLCRMALVEAERALEHWATDEDSLEDQGAVIWRTAQVLSCTPVFNPRET